MMQELEQSQSNIRAHPSFIYFGPNRNVRVNPKNELNYFVIFVESECHL